MPADTLLEVESLSKTYRRGLLRRRAARALDDVTLRVGRGAVFGLLGPNGAGKTTLVKILLGLVHPSAGRASLFGHPAGYPPARRRVGYLPEAHRLPGYLTGRQVLELFGALCGGARRRVRARAEELLERVAMKDDADRKVREYSKGMQQRIGLAQALVHEPELVFLDEPTDGVDPIGRAAIRGIVADLARAGTTVFINSHLLMEVERICDRVVIMDSGRVLRAGSLEELTGGVGRMRFRIGPSPAAVLSELSDLGMTLEPLPGGDHGFDVPVASVDQTVDRLRARGVSIRAIEPRGLSLEEAFIDIVGGDPR